MERPAVLMQLPGIERSTKTIEKGFHAASLSLDASHCQNYRPVKEARAARQRRLNQEWRQDSPRKVRSAARRRQKKANCSKIMFTLGPPPLG